MFLPRWSEMILAELAKNLGQRIRPDRVQRRLAAMCATFPDATITGHEHLIGSMTNHPKDRHVLAAAVADGARLIVTANIVDFPIAALKIHGIVAQTLDEFVTDVYQAAPDQCRDVMQRQAAAYRTPPLAITALLGSLERHAPTMVAMVRWDGRNDPD